MAEQTIGTTYRKRIHGRVWTLTFEGSYWAVGNDQGDEASLEAFEGPQAVHAWAWKKAGYPE